MVCWGKRSCAPWRTAARRLGALCVWIDCEYLYYYDDTSSSLLARLPFGWFRVGTDHTSYGFGLVHIVHGLTRFPLSIIGTTEKT